MSCCAGCGSATHAAKHQRTSEFYLWFLSGCAVLLGLIEVHLQRCCASQCCNNSRGAAPPLIRMCTQMQAADSQDGTANDAGLPLSMN